jgi:hypothetical protein
VIEREWDTNYISTPNLPEVTEEQRIRYQELYDPDGLKGYRLISADGLGITAVRITKLACIYKEYQGVIVTKCEDEDSHERLNIVLSSLIQRGAAYIPLPNGMDKDIALELIDQFELELIDQGAQHVTVIDLAPGWFSQAITNIKMDKLPMFRFVSEANLDVEVYKRIIFNTYNTNTPRTLIDQIKLLVTGEVYAPVTNRSDIKAIKDAVTRGVVSIDLEVQIPTYTPLIGKLSALEADGYYTITVLFPNGGSKALCRINQIVNIEQDWYDGVYMSVWSKACFDRSIVSRIFRCPCS